MCIQAGRKCPGLQKGPLIVDMTGIAKHGMRKRQPKPSAKRIVMPVWPWINSADKFLPTISQRFVVTEAFYARFLAYFTSEGESKDIQNRRTWLHSLPILYTDGTNDALVLAVQGTASAYCAVEIGNLALVQHSWQVYGEALRKHTGLISRSTTKHEVTVHMVSTSVLFSFFEAMQATSADAYCAHIYGAVRMLQITKPKQCSQGVLCQIFYHLRTQLAFINLASTGRGASVQVQQILYGALEYNRLPMFQRVMNHTSSLVEMYVKRRNGETQQSFPRTAYAMIKAELESLWHEYQEEAANMGTPVLRADGNHGAFQFRDAFTALTVAYFSAASILLDTAGFHLTNSSLGLADYYATILQASRHLQSDRIALAYMRMAVPLLLVALHSPGLSQREQAAGCFKHWTNGSMSGISALALEAIGHHHAIANHELYPASPSA
ncbi:uncharacterized protein yc1106_02532 [Curvularia clavata]|uniref:Uncharacterized protein n=1 Tax=Curvularia clavata TaxID=95742 RepID=A0A9Q8Z7E9_CURCL|nr:uncharacterized protein yc1106_02532 [Curvularia clavata]